MDIIVSLNLEFEILNLGIYKKVSPFSDAVKASAASTISATPIILLIIPKPRTLILFRNKFTIDTSKNHHVAAPTKIETMPIINLAIDISSTKLNLANIPKKRNIIIGLEIVIKKAVPKS